MSMYIHNLSLRQFLRLEFLIKIISNHGRSIPTRIPHWKIKRLHCRKPTSSIGKTGHAYVCNPFQDSIIHVRSLEQCASGKIGDLYPAIGALFYFLCPGCAQAAIEMCRREKVAVS